MTKAEFVGFLRRIPGHEMAEISQEEYTRIEYVYMFHPAIPDVGGKDVIAHIYAYGGMIVIRDMFPRAQKADEAEQKIRAIRKDIEGMEKMIADLMAEICA